MTKLALFTTAAAILFGSLTASFAAPKQKQPQRIAEPAYFTLATGNMSTSD